MNLDDWGWGRHWQGEIDSISPSDLNPGRVIAVHRDLSLVQTAQGERPGLVSGKFRHGAQKLSDYPAVGDWVLADTKNPDLAVLHHILPRKTTISRKAAGNQIDEQILATNVDIIFVVTAFDDDFNVRRLERYVLLAHQSGIDPVILVNKADLAKPDDEKYSLANDVLPNGSVHRLSAQTGDGVDIIQYYLSEGKTGIFLGSSGVGKSTVLNGLLGQNVQSTQTIRLSDGKGRHTTTAREMFRLPHGGLIIDTPGLREVQLWGDESALSEVFDEIKELAKACQFNDCRHGQEPGCAIQAALEDGTLPMGRYQSFLKLQKEMAYLERKKDPQQRANTKRRWKKIHENMRDYVDRKRKGF
ncbi:ribosome small subunit-dependent GTPase A [bacterium F11]|nr:ribosome small subunit-dependent GTPase A [bacterium F11]